MSQFTVDEVAIFQNARFLFEKEGTDVLVVAPLGTYQFFDRVTYQLAHGTGYVIVFPDGETIFVRPHQLRKKPPKQSDDEWAAEHVAKVTKPVAQPEGVPA